MRWSSLASLWADARPARLPTSCAGCVWLCCQFSLRCHSTCAAIRPAQAWHHRTAAPSSWIGCWMVHCSTRRCAAAAVWGWGQRGAGDTAPCLSCCIRWLASRVPRATRMH